MAETTSPNAAAPDPLKVAREAVATFWADRREHDLAADVRRHQQTPFDLYIEFAILGARAMQEAMSAQGGGEVKPVSSWESGVNQWAGHVEPHDDIERSVLIVRHAYDWTLDDEGRLCGLVAGDQGYASTHIVVPPENRPAPEVKDARAETVHPDLAHVINEMSDVITSDIQWMRNVRDGISRPAEALKTMEECWAYVSTLSRSALSLATPPAGADEGGAGDA